MTYIQSKLEEFDKTFRSDSNGAIHCREFAEDGSSDYDFLKSFLRTALEEQAKDMIEPNAMIRFVDEKLKEQGEKIRDEVKKVMLLYKNADFSLDEEIARHIIKVINEVCNNN